ncbi:Flp family type IVb pilin [Sphingorhabdus sp.]|uniref:Flp family type IVb pilin n=1 Tax=Sphingorhabdus sp. TaxID=1902408 RepID=UPI0037CA3FFB
MPATKDRRGTNKMLELIRLIQKCDQGATAVEYSLIVALIIIAVMASLGTVANGIQDIGNKVSTELSTS